MQLPALHFGNLASALPIVQGGMGVGISLSGLASAVADAGGIGVIAAAMPGIAEPDIRTQPAAANKRALKREIQTARERTRGILGVNIMVALSNFTDMVRTSVDEGIDIIFSGAGLPLDLPGYLPDGAETKLVPIVSSARAAVILCKKWLSRFGYLPDGFVVEGPEAGGHIGFKAEQIENPDYSLERLVPEVIQAVTPYANAKKRKIPIIAAGGIFTGNDILKFIRMGAGGVQMGTRFVATHECDASRAFKQAYIDARKEDMVIIKSPVGMPGRAVRNTFIDAVNRGDKKPFSCPYHCIRTCKRKDSPYCIALALSNAKEGRLAGGFAFAGKNAYRVDRIVSVRSLIDSLCKEYCQALTGAQAA